MERMRHRDERMTLRVYAKVMKSRHATVDAALDALITENKSTTKSDAGSGAGGPTGGAISLEERSG